jgi:Mn2+/Fe2+ NRAMP family transporter
MALKRSRPRGHRPSRRRRLRGLAVSSDSLAARLARERNPIKRFFMVLGPGLITGASDDDPSGIGTYAQAGAALGYASLWTALVTFPMMWSVQFICAKIGMVTGGGLARVLRRHYPRWLLYPVVGGLVVANTINAGVDIGAIAAAINLLVPIPIAALFFWQANQEVEEEISMGRRTLRQRVGATTAELKYAGWDVAGGMFFSNVVMYFIILAAASTLFNGRNTTIESAVQAAQALRPLAGDAAYLLWAPGLIGAGVLCVPILTGSAAYAAAEAMGWKRGLDERPKRAKLFYGVIALSTIAGMLINFVGVNPITALFWTAVINGFLAPPILVVVMLVANNKSVLGEHVNGPVSNAVGWATTVAMSAAAAALLVAWGR